MAEIRIPDGNPKLKKPPKDARPQARRRALKVFNHNIPAFKTCPGSSKFCEETCYADPSNHFTFRLHEKRYENTLAVIEQDPDAITRAVLRLPKNAWVRIHASGDFYSVKYIKAWVKAASARPDIKFWAYTRSWRTFILQCALEIFKRLPNVTIFASTDKTIEELPPGSWRVAAIEGDERTSGLLCPEQTGKMSDCVDCGYCIIAPQGDVIFKVH